MVFLDLIDLAPKNKSYRYSLKVINIISKLRVGQGTTNENNLKQLNIYWKTIQPYQEQS